MKLNLTNKFKRESAKLIKRNPLLRNKLSDTLKTLSEDLFHPSLKTHKLKGEFGELWSVSLTFGIRIIIKFREIYDEKVIDLLTIGRHDQIY